MTSGSSQRVRCSVSFVEMVSNHLARTVFLGAVEATTNSCHPSVYCTVQTHSCVYAHKAAILSTQDRDFESRNAESCVAPLLVSKLVRCALDEPFDAVESWRPNSIARAQSMSSAQQVI